MTHAFRPKGDSLTLNQAIQYDRDRMVTPDEAAQLVSEYARNLLAAIGEEE